MRRSRTNVDVAREMIACVNRADDDGLAALMSLDVRCFPDRNGPEAPFRGREAFLRYARGWTEAFEHYAVESCEYLDFGEYVIVIGPTVARGRGSGVETSSEDDTWLFRFRDGEAIEYHECDSTQEALGAVGALATRTPRRKLRQPGRPSPVGGHETDFNRAIGGKTQSRDSGADPGRTFCRRSQAPAPP